MCMSEEKDMGKTYNFKRGIRLGIIWAAAYCISVLTGILTGYGITGIDVVLPLIMLFTGFLGTGLFLRKENPEADCLLFPSVFLLKWKQRENRNLRSTATVMGCIFSLTIVVGRHIDMDDRIFTAFVWWDVLIFLFLSAVTSFLCFGLFLYSDRVQPAQMPVDSHTGWEKFCGFIRHHIFGCSFLLYWLAFLPYYLTFFPGNSGRDTMESISMVLGKIPWTNHHPVLFTALIGLFIKIFSGLSSLSVSLGLFSLFQMTTMAFFLAYLTKRIVSMKTLLTVKVFTVLMFAFHPIVAMYSIYLSKDVLFSECLILAALCLYDLIKSRGELLKQPGFCVKLFLFTVLAALLRNNGLYVAAVLLIVLPFVYKKYVKQLLLVFGTAVALLLIWQGPLFHLWGIEKESFAEAASVPLQQVGYVIWSGGEFSEEDTEFLETLMPFERVKEVYVPGYTDPYKFDAAFQDDFLNENVAQFMKVWWHGCCRHFPEYVKAYLMQTVGYWHYGETNSVCTQGVTENTLGIVQNDLIEKLTGHSLEGVMEKLVLAGRKAPLICILSSMGMQILMVVLLGIQYVRRKEKTKLLFLIPFAVLWGTVMIATPAFCLLRYLYPLFLMWPFFIGEFFLNGKTET